MNSLAGRVCRVVVCLASMGLALPAMAQAGDVQVIQEVKHDTSPPLREIEPLLPEYAAPYEVPNKDWDKMPWDGVEREDPVLQSEALAKPSPPILLQFAGLGDTDPFFCNCEPPDTEGAPGATQYVQFVNLSFEVFSKTGARLHGPVPGNNLWSGFGGPCQTDNNGDPIVRFDAMAQRWVLSQFAVSSGPPFFECVAVSTTADATGSYHRYAFQFSNFPDYPKMAVWPDAYYFTFNNFDPTGSFFVGADACAANRTNMLAGLATTMQCFQQGNSIFGMLPSDLDGPTKPAAGTQNFIINLGMNALRLWKFHVDFVNPQNSRLTGPTTISVAAFTPLCPTQFRGQCVPQKGTTQVLESLGNRPMYRLVYRNFTGTGAHSTLLISHSIKVGANSGGVRWYEMRNPETTHTIFQSGTFAPDGNVRWLPSIAMDKVGDIAVGYSKSSTTVFPSILYAGRTPSDSLGTLEAEVNIKAGSGSENGTHSRWGDYSAMNIDPVDDCTFWYTNEYLDRSADFVWRTQIAKTKFPNCH